MCHQSVGLLARQLEATGIPTLCMGSALDIMQAVHPPRAVFLDFPLGHTTGKPHETDLQRDILVQAFTHFAAFTEPGSIATLPFRWSDDDAWKDAAQRGPDDRLPRYATPQYQTEDDRRRAETNDMSCAACVDEAPISTA